jgi:hypothetical protein
MSPTDLREGDDIVSTLHAGLTKPRLDDGKYWAAYGDKLIKPAELRAVAGVFRLN